MTLSQFLTIVLVTATAPGVVLASAGGAIERTSALISWFCLFPGIGAGVVLPFMFCGGRQEPPEAIWRSMPNAIDLMTTCVEAG